MNLQSSRWLQLAVNLRIAQIKFIGYMPESFYDELKIIREIPCGGDIPMFRGKNGSEKIKLFNQISLAIAVLAFTRGGIDIFGFKFEAKLPNPRNPGGYQ